MRDESAGTAPPADPPATGLASALIPGAALPTEQALALLRHGEMDLEGRLVDASNTTLRAFLTLDGVSVRCVYKPIRGERPLWDFPDGTLAGREAGAYLVSAATGWDVVPPTTLRGGPLGEGACQIWVDEPDDAEPLVGFVAVDELPDGWLSVAAARDDEGNPYVLAHADDARLARLAVFDAVVNNADRKGGHILHMGDGRLYGVDHGVCFHGDEKLRTVLWGFVGRPLPAEARAVLDGLRRDLDGALGRALGDLLTPAEVRATADRIARLLASGEFPEPAHDWPPVPWPPL